MEDSGKGVGMGKGGVVGMVESEGSEMAEVGVGGAGCPGADCGRKGVGGC